ncbi:protein KRI1 homolog [Stigmatopora argus]
MNDKTGFRINTQFAEKYDKYRQREELQRLKDRYGDRADEEESESSESSSDDSEVDLDPEIERDFYRTLSLLKKKDPKIYEKDAKFYSKDSPNTEEKPSTSNSKVKPMYLKDYERKVILEKEGKYEDEDSDSDNEEAAKRRERAFSPSYMQEQKQLKESFQKFVQDSDDDDDNSEGSGEEGVSQLLTRRLKTQEEQDEEEADYVEWLKGQKDLDGPEEVKEMKYLRDYWNDPELDEEECFLRDYVLNKRYKDDDDQDDERIPTYEEVVEDDSEEEEETFLVRQENFERGYNFRFEEPDAERIKTYPRTIATSVRTKDDRRKCKREEVTERKEMMKQQKRENLKQMKNLKRNEIMEKLKKLQQLTGNDDLAFNPADLQGDFDSQHHDQLMQKFFDEKYYGEQEDDKPQFEDDDEVEEHWNWDTWTGKEQEEYNDEEDYDASEPHCDDQDFIMDADYDPSQHVSKKQKKKMMKKADIPLMGNKKKKCHFAEVLSKDKPVFDPQVKSFEEYLDEYYKLDYEDIIDDLPCRFRYRQVLANNFGLSTDEILGADDQELNKWCALKKACMFRSDQEEKKDLKNYKIKSKNVKKKRQILHSVYSEKDTEGAPAKAMMGKKRRDRVKNAERNNKEAEDRDAASKMDASDETANALREVGSDAAEPEEFLTKKIKLQEEPKQTLVVDQEVQVKDQVKTKLPKKNKQFGRRRKMGSVGVKIGGQEFSRQRLKAYGFNPKRLFFRQLGRQRRKEQLKKEKEEKKLLN